MTEKDPIQSVIEMQLATDIEEAISQYEQLYSQTSPQQTQRIIQQNLDDLREFQRYGIVHSFDQRPSSMNEGRVSTHSDKPQWNPQDLVKVQAMMNHLVSRLRSINLKASTDVSKDHGDLEDEKERLIILIRLINVEESLDTGDLRVLMAMQNLKVSIQQFNSLLPDEQFKSLEGEIIALTQQLEKIFVQFGAPGLMPGLTDISMNVIPAENIIRELDQALDFAMNQLRAGRYKEAYDGIAMTEAIAKLYVHEDWGDDWQLKMTLALIHARYLKHMIRSAERQDTSS